MVTPERHILELTERMDKFERYLSRSLARYKRELTKAQEDYNNSPVLSTESNRASDRMLRINTRIDMLEDIQRQHRRIMRGT